MDNLMYIRIGQLCEKKNISVAQLERILGLSESSIRKWGNPVSPSVDKVVKVADYFNVRIDYLTGRTDIECLPDALLQNR